MLFMHFWTSKAPSGHTLGKHGCLTACGSPQNCACNWTKLKCPPCTCTFFQTFLMWECFWHCLKDFKVSVDCSHIEKVN